jgi:hypothetical protein
MEKQPLSVMLENAKGMTYQAFNQVQEKTQLPAYLMEGIIMEILADIRNQKNLELVSDFNRMQESQEQEERKVEE